MSFSPSNAFRWFLLVVVLLAAGWLRLRDLSVRPMHADEANQAVKLGTLLEAGRYAFDPRDHHGPTLYFAAVPVAWLRGEKTLAELTETTVRLVPASFGTAAVLLLYLLVRPSAPAPSGGPSAAPAATGARGSILGSPWTALAAAAFLAVAPPAVYYSRYFIQETLLAAFTLAALLCARRLLATGTRRWAVLLGVSAGLMQATKASAPLFLAAAALAWFAARPAGARLPGRQAPLLAAAAGAFVLTAALFYSSFLTHPAGIRDALAAYAHAVGRFGTDAPATGHEKPFFYYLNLFGWQRTGGLVWHQLALAALALAGAVVALVERRRSPRLFFVFIFTAALLVAFSAFPYKTPWHAVHFAPGLCVLAAAAVAAIARLPTGKPVAWAFALLTLGTLHQQTGRAAFLRPADQRNPYAYVHSAPDVRKYRDRAEAAVRRFPDLPVRVIADEYWPLPWYLRDLPQVGYYAEPPPDCDAAFLVVAPEKLEAVRSRLRHRYAESFLGLRPGVILVLLSREP